MIDERDDSSKYRLANVSVCTADSSSFYIRSIDIGSANQDAQTLANVLVDEIGTVLEGKYSKVASIASDTNATMRSLPKIVLSRPVFSHCIGILCDSHGYNCSLKIPLLGTLHILQYLLFKAC